MPDLVAIDLPGGTGFVTALRRAWAAGDAALPVDQRLPATAKHALVDAMAPARVVGPDGEARLGSGRPVERGDCLVMATSGTTGHPKGVVLTMDAVAASARATSARLGVDPGSHRWLACLPLSHIGGMSVVARSLVTGTPFTVLPGFEAAEVQARSGPDVYVSLVPTAYQRVRDAAFRAVVLGGSAPPASLPANVVTTYGMTETGSGVVYDGRPLDGVEVRLEPSTGEISLRAPMLLRCYRDGTIPFDGGGWFATGDAGSVDAQGRLVVHGRIGDLIITGGENVWPGPVEDAIRASPKVAEVAVAGVADPEWGQRVVAWVVPADPSDPPNLGEVRDLVGMAMPRYAAPRELVLTGFLPRTPIGKVRRGELTG